MQSVIILAGGSKSIFITGEWNDGISDCLIKKVIKRYPDAETALMFNLTYLGICTNLKVIVNIARYYNIPVLIEKANGTLVRRRTCNV